MFKITIPVKPHIKAILLKYYPEEPRKLTATSTIGVVLYHMLSKTQIPPHPEHYRRPDDTITFTLSEFDGARTGFQLSDQHVYQFNNMIDKAFREQVYLLTGFAQAFRNNRKLMSDKAAIEWLNSHYNIGEDQLQFETIKKSNSRRRIAREQKRAVFFL